MNPKYERYKETHAFHQALRAAGRIKKKIETRAPLTINAKAYRINANAYARGALTVLLTDPVEGRKMIRRMARWVDKVMRMSAEAQSEMLVLWEKWEEIDSALKKGISENAEDFEDEELT